MGAFLVRAKIVGGDHLGTGAKRSPFGSFHGQVRDETDREGLRIVIECGRQADPDGVLAFFLKKTDLQINYTYFRTSNYEGNGDVAVPFGSAQEEHQFNAVVSRQLTENMRGLVRYAYYEGREVSPRPALNGFQAHVLYTSLFYRF